MRTLLMLLRRLRALAVNAFLWAVVWSFAGAFVGVYAALRGSEGIHPFLPDVVFFVAFLLGFYGAAGGLLFGLVLMFLQRRGTLQSISLGRAAVWGALAALGLPSLFAALGREPIPTTWSIVVLFGLLGVACASGTLALARRPDTVQAV
jgi:hypothetical protein